jgi:hypothetical protein
MELVDELRFYFTHLPYFKDQVQNNWYNCLQYIVTGVDQRKEMQPFRAILCV